MVFYGVISYRYDVNDWCHDVVPAVRCIRSFCERKLIYSHPNNSRHPFYQPDCKNIMVVPMNVKEFDNFFGDHADQVAIFRQNFVQNCEFRFFVQNAKFRDFVRFSSKTNFSCPYRWFTVSTCSQIISHHHMVTVWRLLLFMMLLPRSAMTALATVLVRYPWCCGYSDVCLFYGSLVQNPVTPGCVNLCSISWNWECFDIIVFPAKISVETVNHSVCKICGLMFQLSVTVLGIWIWRKLHNCDFIA